MPDLISANPAISIVIPMYNVEKYIGACLSSILSQTFENFEVVVVDDCSTDNSCAVVESFTPKFGGRLKLFHTEKNSGGAGIPSNLGVKNSRGKYIYFVDDDDLITDTALEELYTAIEEFKADAVQTSLVFEFVENTEELYPTVDDVVVNRRTKLTIGAPKIESENFKERAENFLNGCFAWQAWATLVKRDVLIENEILFPDLKSSTDILYTFQLIFSAKKFVHIPNACYVYRHRKNSTVHKERGVEEQLTMWLETNLRGIDFLMKFFDRKKFFHENPQYIWKILDHFNQIHFNMISKIIATVPPHEVIKILQSNFKKIFGDYCNLIAYLCTTANFTRWDLMLSVQHAENLERKLNELRKF